MPSESPLVATIVAFLDRIGIPVTIEPVAEGSFLPGVTVRYGTLIFDPANLPHPGDLLHEAGHIALTDPEVRGKIAEVSESGGEEMGAIAWSYAAALELGIDPAVVFHEEGYQGGSENILRNFGAGQYFGVSLLDYYGMTAEAKWAEAKGIEPYPKMARWLR
jgi:hypothetical protein